MATANRRAPGERITVSVQAGLSRLLPPYLARRRTDVADIVAALEHSDFARIETIGHRMRGNGASMGFMTISRIGEDLERAAPAADREQIEALRIELLDFLDHVDVAYD